MPRKPLLLISTLLVISTLGSCSSMQKAEEVIAWAKDKTDFLDQKIEKVQAIAEDAKEYTAAKVEEIEKNQAEIEKRTGAFDINGDGQFTGDEAKEIVKKVTTNPGLWDLLFDKRFWIAIAGALGLTKLAGLGINLRDKKVVKKAQEEPTAE